jgi:hypothetical protein
MKHSHLVIAKEQQKGRVSVYMLSVTGDGIGKREHARTRCVKEQREIWGG